MTSLLLRDAGEKPEKKRQAAPGSEEESATEKTIRCAACAAHVSDASAIFSPTGGPSRRLFANPSGQVFEILTLRWAHGHAVGERTLEFTWFPGFAWRGLLCAGCARHLGWRFDSTTGGEDFCGLITSTIVEGP